MVKKPHLNTSTILGIVIFALLLVCIFGALSLVNLLEAIWQYWGIY